MSTDHYLREKCGPDSSAFYAVLFAPRAKQEALRAMHVLGSELREMAEQPRELAVTQTRLEWWRAEVERAAAGAPRHPVMHALAAALAARDVTAPDLHSVLDAAEMALAPAALHSLDDFARYSDRTAGALFRLTARLLGLDAAAAEALVAPLATAHELTRLITTLGADRNRSAQLIPREMLELFGIGPGDWRGSETSVNLRRLLEHLAAAAEAHYARVPAPVSATDLVRARPLLIQAAIERARLKQVAADGFAVLREQTTLPPPRMLFIAIRARIWPAHLDA